MIKTSGQPASSGGADLITSCDQATRGAWRNVAIDLGRRLLSFRPSTAISPLLRSATALRTGVPA